MTSSTKSLKTCKIGAKNFHGMVLVPIKFHFVSTFNWLPKITGLKKFEEVSKNILLCGNVLNILFCLNGWEKFSLNLNK